MKGSAVRGQRPGGVVKDESYQQRLLEPGIELTGDVAQKTMKKALLGELPPNHIFYPYPKEVQPRPPFTPLHFAAQWRKMNADFGTNLGVHSVKKLLELGADVNFVADPRAGVTALYVAIKYSDAATVEALLQAGADINHKDVYNRTILANTIESYSVPVIEKLMAFGFDPTRKMGMGDMGGGPYCDAADMVFLLGTTAQPISWRTPGFGPPTAQTWARLLEFLLDKGCMLSADALGHAAWGLQACTNPTSIPWGRMDEFEQQGLKLTMEAALALVGSSALTAPLPRQASYVPAQKPRDPASEGAVCGGKGPRVQSRPRLLLPRPDVVGEMGMSEAQLRMECAALEVAGVRAGSTKEELAAALAAHTRKLTFGVVGGEEMHIDSSSSQNMAYTPQLSRGQAADLPSRFSTMSMEDGSQREIRASVLAPLRGPVVAPIRANGKRCYAFLSTASTVTAMSEQFAKNVGLELSPIKSGAIDCVGHPCKNVRLAMGKLVITVGDNVNVEIRNAVVCEGWTRGIQLGLDFFSQSVWCQLDLFVANETTLFCLRPGLGGSDLFYVKAEVPPDTREEMRFYAEDGGMAAVELMHLNDGIQIGRISVELTARIDECAWCGRMFPSLKACPTCNAVGIKVHYCSDLCQKADWKTHKKTPPHLKEKEAKEKSKQK